MCKRIILSFLLIPIFTPLFSQQYATGGIIDTIKYKKIEKVSRALGFSDPSKPSYSLKEFCPIPGYQGSLGTCTSWATGYAALTIAWAIQNNIRDKNTITNNAKSALFLFNQAPHPDCNGALQENILKILQTKGDCNIKDFNPTDCFTLPNLSPKTNIHNIQIIGYYGAFDLSDSKDSKISAIINSINSNKPVIVDLILTNDLQNVGKDGLYKPILPYNGEAHAVCLIGYNNINKEFEFINSWGTSWGDSGFFKMSYNDFIRDCKGAYVFSLKKLSKAITLNGTFHLLKFDQINPITKFPDFKEIQPILNSKKIYTIENTIKKDDLFRLKATDLSMDTYVYILTFKPDGTAEILFPLRYSSNDDEEKDIPLITGVNATINLPENYQNAYSTDLRGDDVLCILYSKKRINDLDESIKNYHSNENIRIWLKNTFGSDLINSDQITYSGNSMSFTTIGSPIGSILPIILQVHVN